MKVLIVIIVILVLIYAFLCIFLYVKQDALLYFPSRNQEVLDLIHSNASIEEFTLLTENDTVIGRAS